VVYGKDGLSDAGVPKTRSKLLDGTKSTKELKLGWFGLDHEGKPINLSHFTNQTTDPNEKLPANETLPHLPLSLPHWNARIVYVNATNSFARPGKHNVCRKLVITTTTTEIKGPEL
jgi:hypothetical protein